MTTEGRSEADRRSARKSSGPKTEGGKNRSRLSARRHEFKAVPDGLPAVDPQAAKERYEAWMADLQPRDSSERTCLATAVFHSLELDRVMLAQNARITAQIENAPAEQARREQEEVMALGKRLFPSRLIPQKWIPRPAALPESPARITRRLQTTAAGCLWLLDRWAELKAILNRNLPWQPSDKFKLVRLLGREPLDAVDDPRVAQLFLACHVLNGKQGSPYQDIADELNHDQRICFKRNIAARNWDSLRPEDATQARNMLRLIVTQAIEWLELPAEQRREQDLQLAETAAVRLSFDFSPEGERLRRYELKCHNAMLNAINQFLKLRRAATRRTKVDELAMRLAAIDAEVKAKYDAAK